MGFLSQMEISPIGSLAGVKQGLPHAVGSVLA